MAKQLRMGLGCGTSSSPSLEVFSSPYVCLCVLQADSVGLAGAIVRVARDGSGAAAEQPEPHGVTVYYIVDSLKLVSLSTRLMKKCSLG
jgi:hypothetical protein